MATNIHVYKNHMSSPQPHIFLHPSTIIYYLSAFWSYYRSPHRLYWHNMTEINRVNRQKSTKIDANWQESLKSTSFEFREIPIFDYGKSQHVLTKYRHVSWKYRHVQTEVDCWIYPQNVKVADGGGDLVMDTFLAFFHSFISLFPSTLDIFNLLKKYGKKCVYNSVKNEKILESSTFLETFLKTPCNCWAVHITC